MNPKRILIVRTSAIGDVVMTSALPAALRQKYPEAYIAWLVEPGIHELLTPDPNINEVILWPKNSWKKLWKEGRRIQLIKEILQYKKQLQAYQFDTALDLQGLLKSGFLSWLSGAPNRIGLGSKEGSQWLMTDIIERDHEPRELMSSEYHHFAKSIGLSTATFHPHLTASSSAEESALTKLTQNKLAPGQYAVLAPFTTRPQKHWFEQHWKDLSDSIINETGLTPVILGAPGDKEAADRISAGNRNTVNLAGTTNLAEAVAIISNAALVVGVDTGLTHIGTALNRPTVAIFGSTCPYKNTGRPNGRVIWLGLGCSPCRRRPSCNGEFTCLRSITPERVMNEVQAVLTAASDQSVMA
jgi:heptosyltransferase I